MDTGREYAKKFVDDLLYEHIDYLKASEDLEITNEDLTKISAMVSLLDKIEGKRPPLPIGMAMRKKF